MPSPGREDPYLNFTFRVTFDGQEVKGISRVTGLRRLVAVVSHREGGDNQSTLRKSPGLTTYEPVLMVRALGLDQQFEQWAELVPGISGSGGANFRKVVVIELLDESGNPLRKFKLHNCWPSEFVAFGQLESDGSHLAVESIRLEHEGWEIA
jgi:phage tail-like protein